MLVPFGLTGQSGHLALCPAVEARRSKQENVSYPKLLDGNGSSSFVLEIVKLYLIAIAILVQLQVSGQAGVSAPSLAVVGQELKSVNVSTSETRMVTHARLI